MSLRKHAIGGLLFLLIFCGSVAIHHRRPDLPPDESLIRNFRKHRADFDRLFTMTTEDQNVESIFGGEVFFTDHRKWQGDNEREFSWRRWNEYWSMLLRFTDFPVDVVSKRSGALFIFISIDFGQEEHGESVYVEKGYVYSDTEPGPIVDSLDPMDFESRGRFYRKIDKHWYLYYENYMARPE